MSAPVFVVAPGAHDLRVDATVTLDGPEGHHAAAVRRLRIGETVVLVDGRGTSAVTTISAVAKHSVQCLVEQVTTAAAPSPRVTVVQALAKGERADLAVELMTEAGVDEIVPWAAARSIARWDETKAAKGVERWTSVAREAAKQSRRSWIPQIEPLASTEAVAGLAQSRDLVVVLHEEAMASASELSLEGVGSIVIVVGPEGGIAPEEIDIFREASGVLPVRLGPEVVRTSTAGALAAAVLLSRTSRWRAREIPA